MIEHHGLIILRHRNHFNLFERTIIFHEATSNGTHKTEYAYDKDNRVTAVRYNGSNTTKVDYTYDKLNRITSRKTTNGVEYNTQYGYVQGDTTSYGNNATTPLVASITQGSGANAFSLAYTYDSRGNITSETRNGNTTMYEYDALGQLVRVNDPSDPTAYNEGGLSNNGTTWIYAYDRGGNILSKTAYEFTTGTVGTAVRTYLYGYTDTNWKDKLTSFDNSTISYDAIGNPLSDGTWTYVWQAGRQLKSMTKVDGNDTITVEFEYNHAGLRTKKTRKVNSVITEETEYILNGKNVVGLIHTVYTTAGGETTTTTDVLHFYYDAQGRAAMVKHGSNMYGYVHDLQGDVIGILDNTGSVAVEYKYDAWGKPLSVTGVLAETLGILNPFRYRGYVFDQETQLYYLRSRYYNPTICRFQIIDSIIHKNMYPYCRCNPIMFADDDGMADSDTHCYFFGTDIENITETYHVVAIFVLPESTSVSNKAFNCNQYFSVSYYGHEGETYIDYRWDDGLKDYLLKNYTKEEILERSVYVGTCNVKGVSNYIDYTMKIKKSSSTNSKSSKKTIKLNKKKPFYLCFHSFSKYDFDKANCSLFAMSLLVSSLCQNQTIMYAATNYEDDPELVYTSNFYWCLSKNGPLGSLVIVLPETDRFVKGTREAGVHFTLD